MKILKIAIAATLACTGSAQVGIEDLLRSAQEAYSRGDYTSAVDGLGSAWKLADELPATDELRHRTLRQLASTHAALQQWDQAENYLQLAINWKEQTSREVTAISDELSELGIVVAAKGDRERAVEILQRVVSAHWRTRERLCDPAASAALLQIARIHLSADEPERALGANRTALHCLEQAHGKDHPNLLGVLDAVSESEIGLRDYEAAEATLRRALVIRERVHGPAHANLLPTLDGLAYAQFGQQKYDVAEPVYRRLLALWETTSGEFHPMVALTLDKITVFYRVQEKQAEADTAASHAIAIRAHFLASRLVEEAHRAVETSPAKGEALLRQALAALDPAEPRTMTLRDQVERQLEAITGAPAQPTRQKQSPERLRKRKKA